MRRDEPSEHLSLLSMDNDRPLSVRFLFLPTTGSGAITWLAHNREHLAHIRGGLILSNLSDSGDCHAHSTVSTRNTTRQPTN